MTILGIFGGDRRLSALSRTQVPTLDALKHRSIPPGEAFLEDLSLDSVR